VPYSDPVKQKQAVREYYTRNKDAALVAMRASRNRKREKLIAVKNKPCTDCGIQYPPRVMEFHHPNPNKDFSVGKEFHKLGWNTLLLEIEKCALVCANCHRLKHYIP
jgi:hypothetical protein